MRYWVQGLGVLIAVMFRGSGWGLVSVCFVVVCMLSRGDVVLARMAQLTLFGQPVVHAHRYACTTCEKSFKTSQARASHYLFVHQQAAPASRAIEPAILERPGEAIGRILLQSRSDVDRTQVAAAEKITPPLGQDTADQKGKGSCDADDDEVLPVRHLEYSRPSFTK